MKDNLTTNHIPWRACFDHIKSLFEPIPNIFFLLISPDTDETLQILRQRDADPPADLTFNINAHFLRHPGYPLLAKYVIYTNSKTPEQSCSQVVGYLK